MGLWRRLLVTKSTRAVRKRSSVAVQLAIAVSLAMAPHAKASFINDYALDMFTLSNTNANGYAITPDSGLSVQLTGGNTGSGLAGTTDLTVTAAASGVIEFDYSFLSLDSKSPVCGAGSNLACDYGGYLLGGVYTQLANDTNQTSGEVSFNVSAGQTFGFRVGTVDNNGEPGVFTISSFSAPESVTESGVPEPGTAWMLMTALAGSFGVRQWKRVFKK